MRRANPDEAIRAHTASIEPTRPRPGRRPRTLDRYAQARVGSRAPTSTVQAKVDHALQEIGLNAAMGFYDGDTADRLSPAVAQRSAGSSAPSCPQPTTGRAMPAAVQAKMERCFDHDFSDVRIHEGPRAASIGAQAYTQGNDIHFAAGKYQPETPAGQELLGHELTHVVQQSQGRVRATAQARGVQINDDEGLEREADLMGARAARGESVRASQGPARRSSGAGVAQRRRDPAGSTKPQAASFGPHNYHLAKWSQLTTEQRGHFEKLGWTEALWASDQKPDSDNKPWSEIQAVPRWKAAAEGLGYTKATWEADAVDATTSNKSTKWAVQIMLSISGGHAGVGAGFCLGRLKNAKTGEVKMGNFVGGGFGLGAALPGATPDMKSWVSFETEEPRSFADFDGARARLTAVSVGALLIGYSIAILSFPDMGSGAQGLHVGGFSMGSLGADFGLNVGIWNVHGM